MPKIKDSRSPIPKQLHGLHLFHYDAAPCAQRVRFALGEKGLARGREEKFDATNPTSATEDPGKWVSRRVSLPKKDHMSPTYAEIHPNMVVPALVHDGALYLESMDIIEYLDDAFEGVRLVPTGPDLRARTMKRVEQAKILHRSIRYVTFHWGLGRLAMLNPKERKALTDLAQKGSDEEHLVEFYEQYSTGGIPDSVYLDHLGKLFSAFTDLNSELEDGRQYLMSDDVSIADPFWAMKILRLSECGYPTQEYHPALYAWYERIYNRPSFQNEVMGKNRFTNRAFTFKAKVEEMFGGGLKQAVKAVAA